MKTIRRTSELAFYFFLFCLFALFLACAMQWSVRAQDLPTIADLPTPRIAFAAYTKMPFGEAVTPKRAVGMRFDRAQSACRPTRMRNGNPVNVCMTLWAILKDNSPAVGTRIVLTQWTSKGPKMTNLTIGPAGALVTRVPPDTELAVSVIPPDGMGFLPTSHLIKTRDMNVLIVAELIK